MTGIFTPHLYNNCAGSYAMWGRVMRDKSLVFITSKEAIMVLYEDVGGEECVRRR